MSAVGQQYWQQQQDALESEQARERQRDIDSEYFKGVKAPVLNQGEKNADQKSRAQEG